MTTKNSENSGRTQQLRSSNEALWRRIKAAAVLEGITLTKWVETIAEEKLNSNPK